MTLSRPLSLRLYSAARHLIPLIASPILSLRRKRGKEHPTRWVEKLGVATLPRPDGKLIWLHAVGLGEVLSLRGLIGAMLKRDPSLQFLVTTSSLSAAKAFEAQLPLHSRHQFLPLDNATYVRKFLDHWRPNLVIWAEQDIWPGLIDDIAARQIPQALVNARMNERSFKSHQRVAALYRTSLEKMSLIAAQDPQTAQNLTALGANHPISLLAGLKAAAPALHVDLTELEQLNDQLDGALVWVVAPAHAQDVVVAMEAHEKLCHQNPDARLIIAPRDPALPLPANLPRRSKQQSPKGPIWIYDTMGELGLVYALSKFALIGGSFNDIQGHSPWEAIRLGCAVLHGPNTDNFAQDYNNLDDCNGTVLVTNAQDVSDAILTRDSTLMGANARHELEKGEATIASLAEQLLRLK